MQPESPALADLFAGMAHHRVAGRIAHGRSGTFEHDEERGREVVPAMKAQSATACSTLSTTRAPAKMSSAPAASAVDSACGKERGRTRTRSESAMFFMARATEPMFPGWLGSMSTTRTRVVIDDILAPQYATPAQYRNARRAARRRFNR